LVLWWTTFRLQKKWMAVWSILKTSLAQLLCLRGFRGNRCILLFHQRPLLSESKRALSFSAAPSLVPPCASHARWACLHLSASLWHRIQRCCACFTVLTTTENHPKNSLCTKIWVINLIRTIIYVEYTINHFTVCMLNLVIRAFPTIGANQASITTVGFFFFPLL